MKRKLIQLSPSTAVVSLPSSWIKKNKLEKGAEINVEEAENSIIVSAESKKTEKEITIDITKLNEALIWRIVDAVYIAGYDIINVLIKGQEQAKTMSLIPRYFPGIMITDETKNKVRFKDITGNQQEDVDKILSRIFNINIAVMEEGIEAIKTNDYETLSLMKRKDYIINSYVSYCQRQINKFGYVQFSKGGLMTAYLKLLEMISDKIIKILIRIGKEKIKTNEKIISKVLEVYRIIQRLHFGYNQEKLIEFNNIRETLSKNIESSNKNLKTDFTELTDLMFDLGEVEMQINI